METRDSRVGGRIARRLGALAPLMLAVPLASAVTSCANVRVSRLRDPNACEPGIRFYRPHPYVLVKVETDKVTAQIVQLPDRDQEYLVDWNPGFGTVKPSLQLADGWNLTSFNSEIATGASGLADLLAAAGALAFADDGGPDEVKLGLFRLEWVPGEPNGHWKLGDAVEWTRVRSTESPSAAQPQGTNRL